MTHEVDTHVGDRIRHRRWLLGFTQKQVAEKVGVQFQQLQKYEKGVNRVSASRLWELAQALEVPIVYFFEGVDEEYSNVCNIPKDVLMDQQTLALVRYYYAMPKIHRQKLFDLARVLGDNDYEGQADPMPYAA